MMNSEQFRLLQFRGSFSYNSYTAPVEEKKKADEVQEYLAKFIDVHSPLTSVIRKTDVSELNSTPSGFFQSFILARKINNIIGINSYLKEVNEKLPMDGILAICAETLEQRRKRVFKGYPPSKSLYTYFLYDFIINRVFPKLQLTRKLILNFKKRNNRVLSLPEILGRLVFAGFKIIDIKQINNLTYFITQKEKQPVTDMTPSYGIFFKMNRVGKDGKIIQVYKLRTMYPYSEYIQKFIYENYSLSKGGKFNNDIRVTGWGKVLRKYWLDEIPMIFNWIKGDLKMVGLRPLSEHYLSLYNKNLAVNRFKIKPGLIPPFYFDLPDTLDEIMKSEEKYIESYTVHPVKTDITYLIYALKNILLKGARSS